MDKQSLALIVAASLPLVASADEVYFEATGQVAGAAQGFLQSPAYAGQAEGLNLSVSSEAELYWEWNNGDDSLTFVPFARYDDFDSQRTHLDVRELLWNHLADDYEWRVGLGKVFWGVTEFVHLVDTINQTDGVDSVTGEEKLGQPMVNLSLVRDSGIYDIYLLPGFRERTFAGQAGRFRSGLTVAEDAARYQSSDGQSHIDYALRWSHSIDVFDMGLHWFSGTNRDPQLLQQQVNGETRLVPYYEQIDQVGLDLQATLDSWLWKLEALWRSGESGDYTALQGGFEYTFYGVIDGVADLGVLLELGWDDRGTNAMVYAQNDAFAGARLTLNDEASSEALMGVSTDLDYGGASLMLEASRRLGDLWTVSVESQFFAPDSDDTIAYSYDRDDYIQVEFVRYF